MLDTIYDYASRDARIKGYKIHAPSVDGTGDLVDGIVCAFDKDGRSDFFNVWGGREFVEDEVIVDAFEGFYESSALFLGYNGSGRSFKCPDG
jgi:hypothetical protein